MEYYFSLLVFTFVAGITPGPNNMMLMTSGLNHGIKQSLPHFFGICIGFPVMVIIVGIGMATLFAKYPSIYFYLKIAGITYLCFLAWKIANAGNPQATESIKAPITFLQAAAFQWLNPKAWAIAIGALAAFSNKDRFFSSVLVISLAYFIMGLLTMYVWLAIGKSLQGLLNTTKRRQWFNIIMAVTLVLSIIPVAFIDY